MAVIERSVEGEDRGAGRTPFPAGRTREGFLEEEISKLRPEGESKLKRKI